MSDINLVTLTGRLTRDPVLRHTETGSLWGNFTVASNYRYVDSNNDLKVETAFVSCRVFGRWAEALVNRRKGEMAIVVGRLKSEQWEKDGELQSMLVLICDSVRFVTPLNGAKASSRCYEAVPGNGKAGNSCEGRRSF
jgi:single-strand DNA-binding protein